MGALGLGDDDVVVAYDDKGGGVAARLVWMWREIGRRAALLDGVPEEREAGVVTRAPRAPSVVPWPAEALASIDDLPGAPLVDARAGERYRGEHEPIDPTPRGPSPSATSRSGYGSVTTTSTFMPAPQCPVMKQAK